MASVQEKLAESLKVLKDYQDAHDNQALSPYATRIKLMWEKMVPPLFSLVRPYIHSFCTVSSCIPKSSRLKYSSSL